jgi:formylglycine-generating enzyme
MSEPLKPCCTPSRNANNNQSTAGDVVGISDTSIEPSSNPDPDALSVAHPVPGGVFQMGSDRPEAWAADGEGPVRPISLTAFQIDVTAVSNARFAKFVAETGYQTESERFGWSFVFHLHIPKKRREQLRVSRAVAGLDWWLAIPGADWKHPTGPESEITSEFENHPVVHVSWNDAQAFCRWSGKRLPTEAEWECASRGGLDQKLYPWGNAYQRKNQHHCNIFQGDFPRKDTGKDGYKGTCPVDEYEPNGFGLYNCVGNVWEWCQDWFSADYHIKRPDITENPTGPPIGTKRVQRGGSYLCHDSYCNRYRTSARMGNTPDSAGGNVGFRCVRDLQ